MSNSISGMYIVEVTVDDTWIRQKLLVEKRTEEQGIRIRKMKAVDG